MTNRIRARSGRARRHSKPSQSADLFDFAPVTYALLDSTGLVQNVNLAATRLLNASRKYLVGQPLLAFVIKSDRAELIEHFRRCRLSYNVIESEIRFRGKNGEGVKCRVYTKRVSYEGHAAYPTVIIDQTERAQLDEALMQSERERQAAERASELARAGNAAKDKFLATVSHELRTPLTPALLAASQLSSWEELPEEARALASTIARNIQFEARLIDDLLDVARINRHRIVLSLETTDMHELVQEAVDICRPSAEAKQQTLTVLLNAANHYVKVDRSRLRQVFWNLLNNAIKFTPLGGEIVVRTVNESQDVVRVSIRDSGEGMDSETLQNLFAAFDRHSTEHDSRGGLGLGLSICKGIIAAHEGQIWAMSEGPGRGSTFAVELSTERETDSKPEASRIEETNHPSGTRRVLVIEDDPDSREMVMTFLTKYGYEASAAATFEEAIARLDEPWDVILTDLSLPGASGLDIGRHVRQLDRQPEKMISVSGFGSAEDHRASREAGFDYHIVKPLDLDTLLKAVNGARTRTSSSQGPRVAPRAHARAKHR